MRIVPSSIREVQEEMKYIKSFEADITINGIDMTIAIKPSEELLVSDSFWYQTEIIAKSRPHTTVTATRVITTTYPEESK